MGVGSDGPGVETGSLNREDLGCGLGDLIPCGGGTRFGGGVEESSSLMAVTSSSLKSDMGVSSTDCGSGIASGGWSVCWCLFGLRPSFIASREKCLAVILRGEDDPTGLSLPKILSRIGDVACSSSPVGVDGSSRALSRGSDDEEG